jgi:hypothetical protein
MSAARRTDSDCFDRSGQYPVESAHGAGLSEGQEAIRQPIPELGQLSQFIHHGFGLPLRIRRPIRRVDWRRCNALSWEFVRRVSAGVGL